MLLPDMQYECRSPRSAGLTRWRSGAGLRRRDGYQRLARAARKLQSPGVGDLEGQAPAVGGMRARRNSGVCEARESFLVQSKARLRIRGHVRAAGQEYYQTSAGLCVAL